MVLPGGLSPVARRAPVAGVAPGGRRADPGGRRPEGLGVEAAEGAGLGGVWSSRGVILGEMIIIIIIIECISAALFTEVSKCLTILPLADNFCTMSYHEGQR